MLLTPHILAGVTVVTYVPHPVLGLIFAFLSHYFLDYFPQREYGIENIKTRRWRKSWPDFLKVFCDISLALFIIFFVKGYSPLIFAAMFLAVLPDGFTFLSYVFHKNKLLRAHSVWHSKINNLLANKKIPAFWGIVSQIVIMAITIFLLL